MYCTILRYYTDTGGRIQLDQLTRSGNLRTDVGPEDLGSPVGITANDITRSLILAYSLAQIKRKGKGLANNISRVGPVTSEDRSVRTGCRSTSDLGSTLPYNLGKVAGSGTISWLVEVVEGYLSVLEDVEEVVRTVFIGPCVEGTIDIVSTSNTSGAIRQPQALDHD